MKKYSFLALVLCGLFNAVGAHAGPSLLYDGNSGRVLYAEDPDRPWHPASLTKIMTAYLAFEALRDGRAKLTDNLIQSERSIKEPPSKIGFPVGTTMKYDLALQALLVKSANDVAVMFAEKLAGSVSGFSAMMNAKARQLGMKKTNFVNPHGLHNPKHVSTARDMALLSHAMIRDFPQHANRFKQYYVRIGKRRLRSYNSLLKHFKGADGMKTGFVCASGYNVVASATQDGRKLVAVVFGARSGYARQLKAAKLLSYGFEIYDWKMALFTGVEHINRMPLGAMAKMQPANLRPKVCGRPRRVLKRKKNRRRVRKAQRRNNS